MKATHVVRRPFDEGGKTLATGTRVNASAWLNVKLLVDQGYLGPIGADTDALVIDAPAPALVVDEPALVVDDQALLIDGPAKKTRGAKG